MDRYLPHRSLLFLGLVMVLCSSSTVAADDNTSYGPLQESEDPVHERNLPRPRSFVESWHRDFIAPPHTPGRYHLDGQPLLDNILGMLNELGIPLHPHHDPRGLRALGIAASIQIGANYPAVNFHLSDRCPDALTAFYRGGRGLSWAFAWPIESFALRVEGGDDSEFGAYAIAGAQWNHPTLPIAIGVGLPVRMKHADGLVGALIQVRAKLN